MIKDSFWTRFRVAISVVFLRVWPPIKGKSRIWRLIVPTEAWFPTALGIRLRVAPRDYTSRRLILGSPGNDLVLDFAQAAVDGGCFLDIGANRGPYASIAGGAVGVDGSVIAVEPNPSLWKPLLENLEAHVRGRYMLLPMAIAEQAGWMGFSVDSESHTGGGHLENSDEDSVGGKLVAVQTPGAVIEPFVPEESPELRIKIDTEGAELLVLRGLESLLRRPNCRDVLVEMADGHLARFDCTESQIYEFMGELGFNPRISMEQAEKAKKQDGYYDQWFEKHGSES